MIPSNKPLTRWQVWILACRPKTLPAAAATVIMGVGVAIYDGSFRGWPALATLLAALLLQIGANLANDVFDFHRGVDTHERLGPMRVTQAGLLSPRQVVAGMWFVFGLAALLGLYLMVVTGWPVAAIGLAAVIGALAYSGGPLPFGYYGLGDLAVFIFFGPLAVCGSYYIQALRINPLVTVAAIPIGLLIVAILVVNNLRDIATDRATGKRTLAVKLGWQGTRREYYACLVISYLIPVGLVFARWVNLGGLLVGLSLPMAVNLMRAVATVSGRSLNKTLAGTGKLSFIFGGLFVVGINLVRWLVG